MKAKVVDKMEFEEALEELEEIVYDTNLPKETPCTPDLHRQFRSVLGQINCRKGLLGDFRTAGSYAGEVPFTFGLGASCSSALGRQQDAPKLGHPALLTLTIEHCCEEPRAHHSRHQ